jgi:hypothetical protein
MKCGKFRTKNQLQAGMRHTQKYQSNRVKTKQENNDKYEQRVTCSKSSIVVALCLLTAEKWMWKKNCWFLSEIASEKSAVKVVADGVHTAKSSKQNHLWGQKRERLALMTADVWVWWWVYNSTIQRVQPDRGHRCGVSATRGTTAGGLYKSTVQND